MLYIKIKCFLFWLGIGRGGKGEKGEKKKEEGGVGGQFVCKKVD